MKKFNLGFLALAIACSLSVVAQAGSVFFTGDVGIQPPGKTSGVINVMLNLDAGQSFQNGGVVFDVSNSGNAVSFSDAEVLNPSNRWTIATDITTESLAQLNTASFFSPGLPAGGQNVQFATINWTRGPGNTGTTSNIDVIIGVGAFFDGAQGDVTSSYTGVANVVSFVPEPGSLTMAGMCLVGLAMRRRNG